MNTPTRRNMTRRKGSVIVLSCFLMIFMMAILALAVDLGYIYNVRAELDRAVDAGALAGAGALSENTETAFSEVHEFVNWNAPTGEALASGDVVLETGDWDSTTGTFTVSADTPSAIRVQATKDEHRPLFFAKTLGRDSFPMTSSAIAVYQPRDMMLVLDYSGSMNDDSELKSIGSMGQTNIEANLYQIWTELGSPTYGNMGFTPIYSSSNTYSGIKSDLGITSVSYPYPSGSWDDFIYYVYTDSNINNAGYRKEYGLLTLINYWLEKKPKNSQTPVLDQVSAQPITAVKDSVAVFLSLLEDNTTDDRLGLAIYNSSSGYGLLEQQMSDDFDSIQATSDARQAGHYHTMTNIAAGLKEAREELEDRARPNAFKMIVLMTDGQANYPNSSTADDDVRDEVDLCVDNGYPVVTISLGAGADTALMQEVADDTDGFHFNIPGGQSVSAYEEQLIDAFQEIANKRPVRLVK